MKKRIKKILKMILVILLILVAGTFLFLQLPFFGRLPQGERLEKIKKSPEYKDGQFRNINETPDLAEGVTYYTVFKEFFFNKSKRSKPEAALPSQKTDLLHLAPDEDILVWFGHSSYFIKTGGKTILADPVFSGAASPVSFTTKAFAGTDVYTADDFPDIDYLFISHDHWDHMDYKTLLKLKPKVKKIITGLGTGEHLERWGFDMAIVEEHGWNTEIDLGSGFKVYTTPGRHFSGRGLKRNQAMWMSFVLQTPGTKIFLGGDSGYDTHFKTIGDMYGPFDLAILECGQYDKYWKYIHMMPEEVVKATQDLKATKLLPVHWAKFSLALHAWDEPILKVTAAAAKANVPVLTPMIGQKVQLKQGQQFDKWWEGLE